jgi:hypothetical protein
MIHKGSRYYYQTIDYFSTVENEAENPVVFYAFPEGGLVTYSIHVVVEGERLDGLASKYYSRPSMWWRILEINSHVSDPFNIPAGTILRIPHA